MTTVPTVDFTPAEVKMRVRRDSYTVIDITFNGLDLTGYTTETFRLIPAGETAVTQLTVTLTPGANSVFSLPLDTIAWVALGAVRSAEFELSATTPGGEQSSFLTGVLTIEDSLL